MFAAGLSLLNWLYGFFFVPESLAPENRRPFTWKRANPFDTLKSVLSHKTIIELILCLFFIYVAANATHANWSFFTKEKFDWSPLDIGLSLGFMGIMISIVQGGVMGLFVKKFGEKRATYFGLMCNAFGLLKMGIITQSWMVYAVIVPLRFRRTGRPFTAVDYVRTNSKKRSRRIARRSDQRDNADGHRWVSFDDGYFRFYTNPENNIYLPGAPFFLATVLAMVSLALAHRSSVRHHS